MAAIMDCHLRRPNGKKIKNKKKVKSFAIIFNRFNFSNFVSIWKFYCKFVQWWKWKVEGAVLEFIISLAARSMRARILNMIMKMWAQFWWSSSRIHYIRGSCAFHIFYNCHPLIIFHSSNAKLFLNIRFLSLDAWGSECIVIDTLV